MAIANKTVLITGSNRGIGRALVEEALKRGAKRVYAGARNAIRQPDKRVTPVTLDVTSASQIQRAATEIDTLDILINNAGVAIYDDLSTPSGLSLSPVPRRSIEIQVKCLAYSATWKA
jgi:NAD(P)-dependent dehydrogenase (short-subunit alcohol dehydrogenase family)